MKDPCIHSRAVKLFFAVRAHKSHSYVETDCRFIAREDVQHKCGAVVFTGTHLCLTHELSGDASAALVRRHVQRDDIAYPSLFQMFQVQDDKPSERATLFGDHQARFLRLCKPAHCTASKTKGEIKTNDVERVHRIQIINAIRA